MTRNTTISYLFFSILFIALNFIPDLRVNWMFKIFPIALLGIEVSRDDIFKHKGLLLLAIAASAAGDILLHFDMFVPGLSAFLVAQFFYTSLFYQFRSASVNRIGLTIILILYLIGALIVLLPNLGEMQIPVIAYLIVISIMGVTAVQSTLPLKWAIFGALIFILSDSLIAVNRFVFELPFERALVMSTYYAAQWMLVTGFLKSSMISDEIVDVK